MLSDKNIRLTQPEQTSYYPTFVDSREMSSGSDKKDEAQANKTNEIIQAMYDDLTVKVTQGQINTNDTYRASSYRSQIVDNVKDICYNEFCNMSFDFYTVNIKKESITPLLKLNIDSIIGDVMFVGLDDIEKPTESLLKYGVFIITYNDIADEKQLSFYATEDVPDKVWYCSIQMIINAMQCNEMK